jgi:ABC-type branched-subunit amino acid transport system permease subunit
MPTQSGVFHEDYNSDMQLRSTTMQRFRLVVAIIVLLAMPFVLGNSHIRIINQIMIAAIGAIGLNILTGYTGQISLGQGAFLAVGAYACGLLMVPMVGTETIDFPWFFDWAEPTVRAVAAWAAPWPIALILAAFITAIVGGFFGLPSLRLKGLYLAVATLAAQQIVEWTIKRWDPIDGELDGRTTDALNIPSNLLVDWHFVDKHAFIFSILTVIIGLLVISLMWWMHQHFAAEHAVSYQIMSYVIGGMILFILFNTFIILIDPNASVVDSYTNSDANRWQLNSNEYAYYWFVMPLTLIVTLAATNLFRTHIGRAFIAIRDQDIAAEVMGVNPFQYKVLAFAVSSFIVGLAGGLLALHSTAISFERFTIEVSIEYLAMIIIGGLGSISGSIYGATFIVLLPEMLRSTGRAIAGTNADALAEFNRVLPFAQQGVFGVVIVLTLVVESGGIRKIWQNIKDYFRLWPFDY